MTQYQTIFHAHTIAEFKQFLLRNAAAQNQLACSTDEDATFWHHMGLADLLLEAHRRLND